MHILNEHQKMNLFYKISTSYKMNSDDSYGFAWYMYNMLGAEIYANANRKLYVKYSNNLFDEHGYIGLFKTYAAFLHKLSEKQLSDLENYDSKIDYDWRIGSKIITEFGKMVGLSVLNKVLNLTKSSFVKELSGAKIRLVTHNNQYRVLVLTDEFSISSTLDIVENAYVTLSKLRLTPLVHDYGQLEIYDIRFLYFLTDYIPFSLTDVKAGQSKNELLKGALSIAYSIHGIGYCNQDLADHNFLYDEVNNKIYAIDFTDIEICNE